MHAPFGCMRMSQSDQPDSSVTQAQAEEAVRTLLRWAGEDPAR